MDFDDHDNEEEEEEDMGGIPTYMAPVRSAGPAENLAGTAVRYRECLKNHAVAIGGLAVDGCGEFTAAGEEGTIDALRCVACNCHRNFHRKETESGGGTDRSGFHSPYSPYYRLPVGYMGYNHQVGMQQRLVVPLALPSTSGGGQSMEEQEEAKMSCSGKKRFRTKFSQEQKNKMLAFAERVGWRIQKSDEAEVQRFCEETSIKRHVFKVWMHNNKHTIGKQVMDTSFPPPPPPLPAAAAAAATATVTLPASSESGGR